MVPNSGGGETESLPRYIASSPTMFGMHKRLSVIGYATQSTKLTLTFN